MTSDDNFWLNYRSQGGPNGRQCTKTGRNYSRLDGKKTEAPNDESPRLTLICLFSGSIFHYPSFGKKHYSLKSLTPSGTSLDKRYRGVNSGRSRAPRSYQWVHFPRLVLESWRSKQFISQERCQRWLTRSWPARCDGSSKRVEPIHEIQQNTWN